MPSDISVKLGVDGEREFKSAVKSCNDELKNMKSALKLVEEETKGQANTLESLTAKEKALSDAVESASKKQKELADIVEKVTAKRDEAKKKLDDLKNSESATAEEVAKAEKEYRNAEDSLNRWQTQLNNATAEEKKLGTELDKTRGHLQEAEESQDRTAHSIDEFGREVKETKDETSEFQNVVGNTAKMEAMRQVADTLSETFKKVGDYAYNAAKEIDAGYDTIIKKTGAAGSELEGMQNVARDIYGSMNVDMGDVGEVVGELNTQFGLQGDELGDLSRLFLKFSKLNNTNVTTSIDDMQNALAAFGLSGKDAEKVLNVMNKTGQKTNVRMDGLLKNIVQNATAFQELGADIYQSIDFMGKFQKAGADSESVLSGLKRALKNATEEGRPLKDALKDLQESIKNGTDGMDGLNTAYELFGRSGAGIFQAVKNGSIDFTELANSTDLLNESTNSINDTYDRTLSSWDKMEIAQNNLKQVSGELAQTFLSKLEPAVDGLTGILQDVSDWFNKLPQEAQDVLGVIGGIGVAAIEVIPQIMSFVTALSTMRIASMMTKNSMSGLASSASGLSAGGVFGAIGVGIAAACADMALFNQTVNEATEAARAFKEEAGSTRSTVEYIGETVDEYKDLGVSMEEASLRAQMSASNVKELSKAYEKSTKSAGTMTDAASLFSKALADGEVNIKDADKAIGILVSGMSGEKGLENAMEDVREAIANGTVKSKEDLVNMLRAMGGAITSGRDLTETVNALADRIEAYVDGTEDWNETLEVSAQNLNAAKNEAEAYALLAEEMTDKQRELTTQTLALMDIETTAPEKYAAVTGAVRELNGAYDEYKAGVQTSIESIRAQMDALVAQYNEVYTATYENLNSQFGLFDQLELTVDKTVTDMITSLDSQIAYMDTYAANLTAAMELGVDDGLIAKLSDGSRESAEILAAIVADGGTNIAELNDKFRQVESGKKDFAAKMADLNTDFNRKMTVLESRMDTAVRNLNQADKAYANGMATIQGAINGAQSQAGPLVSTYTQIAQSAVNAFKRTWDINSPSKVFRKLSDQSIEGAIEGATEEIAPLTKTYTNAAQAAVDAYASGIDISLPDMAKYHDTARLNNVVNVYVGNRQLTAAMADAVTHEISSAQQAGYRGARTA